MIPGIYPKHVKIILMKSELEQPLSKNTPSGGRITAATSLMRSEHVRAIFFYNLCIMV